MRVLVVNETLKLGGAETMAIELANGLASLEGMEVSFAAADGPLRDRLSSNVRRYPIPLYSPLRIPAIINTLKRVVLTASPVIIHSQGATIGILAGMAARGVDRNIKLILTHHSKGFTRLPTSMSISLLKKYTDAYITISRDRYQSLTEGGIPARQVRVIRNFVDVDLLQDYARRADRESILRDLGVDSKSAIVTMIGRFIPTKRFDKFIRILAECSKRVDRPIVGFAIGDGPDRAGLEKQAAAVTGGSLRILFPGYQDDVFRYLSASEVFLFPTEHAEVLPMCLIEALALGVPAVCSNIPGNSDIVAHEETGLLIDGDIADYSEGVSRLLNDRAYADRLSANCIRRASGLFDKKVIVAEIVKVYQRLLKE